MSKRWVDHLDDDDAAFLKRFLLASGSLKGVAHDYGISYPTVRLRLDRLIEKVQLLERHQPLSPFELALRQLHIDGKMDLATVKRLIKLHQQELESSHAHPPSSRGSRDNAGN